MTRHASKGSRPTTIFCVLIPKLVSEAIQTNANNSQCIINMSDRRRCRGAPAGFRLQNYYFSANYTRNSPFFLPSPSLSPPFAAHKSPTKNVSTYVKINFHTCANSFSHLCKLISTRVQINFHNCGKHIMSAESETEGASPEGVCPSRFPKRRLSQKQSVCNSTYIVALQTDRQL